MRPIKAGFVLAALGAALVLIAGDGPAARLDRRVRESAARIPSTFQPREFPHLLTRGEMRPPAQGSTSKAGNARRSMATGLPSVTRGMPRWMQDRGTDPESALRSLRAEREEAVPETVRILAIRVDFANDGAGDESTGDGRFDLRSNEDAKIPVDAPPHNKNYFTSHLEAVRRYYDVQTSGGLVLEYDIYPQEVDSVYHLSDTRRYGPWIFSVSSDSILTRAERFVRESVEIADSLEPAIDWKKYQSFLVFHAGADFQGDVRQDTSYDIPSFNLSLGDSLEVIVGGEDSVRVNLVMVMPETVSQDDFLGALNGVVAHEFGHQLGFFDLYDVFTGLPVVGSFSLMDSGEGMFAVIPDPNDSTNVVAVRGALPASVDPFHRWIFPFFPVRAHQADDGETVNLPAVLEANDLLYTPIHLSEYYLAETRPIDYNGDGQVILRTDPETGVILGPEPAEDAPDDSQARLEYDYLLPGGGVLIWHIDELAAITGLSSPYGSINIFSDRLGVDVEEADGIQDIGTASSEFFGGPYDPYFLGGYTRFGPNTVPDTATNDGSETGIQMEVADSAGVSMRIRVGHPHLLPGFPIGFEGASAPEALNREDLDGDGVEEILVTAGRTILAMTSDGDGFANDGERILFAALPGVIDEGVAVTHEWLGETHPEPYVLARSAHRAYWFEGWSGALIGSWPEDTTVAKVTAGPLSANGVIFVGTGDGVVALAPDGPTANILWTASVSAVPDTVVSLAAGWTDPAGSFYLAAGTKAGRVAFGSLAVPDDTQAPERWPSFTNDAGAGPIRELLIFDAPLRLGEPIGGTPRLLAASEGRRIDLYERDGKETEGWPQTLPDSLAGAPALGDLDGDGILEIAATTRAGDLCLWDLAGFREPGWPRSLWHPDQRRRPICSTGPRIWDIGADGRLELIQLRGDGMVVAIDIGGVAPKGWPYATGAPGRAGPLRLYGPDSSERWYLAEALSDTVTAIYGIPWPGVQVDDAAVGAFPSARAGRARTGVYPDALVPQPLATDAFFDPASVILHPNPVRNDLLRIRYFLSEDATIEIRAYDLAGRPVAKEEWEGHAGAAGETHAWSVEDWAPGAYLLRMTARGAGRARTIERMVAVAR